MSSRILYLSFNDGSDMRVNKEVHTLSRKAQVVLVALGPDSALCYAKANAHTLHFVRGERSSWGTLFRYFARCAYLLLTARYHSVHIINEPQLLALWPFVWFQKQVVIDLFDSIFLRKNRPGNHWKLLKRLVYAPGSRVIVTDENRLSLLPDFLLSKAIVLPNYPYRLVEPFPKVRAATLTIMYYGWLGELRGTSTIRRFLADAPGLRVLMAGWLADDSSRELIHHPRVEWLGVMPHAEALRVVSQRADYILCVYAPVNDNNINASPNKIYDAIQAETPVIINPEVKVAEFVRTNGIGYMLPRYDEFDYENVARELYERRESFVFDHDLRERHTWERVEVALSQAHRV
jgi:hypothetical protein